MRILGLAVSTVARGRTGGKSLLTFLLPPFPAATWHVFGQNYFRSHALRLTIRTALILVRRGQNRAPASAGTGAHGDFFRQGTANGRVVRGT
jgi:hypothetical protein